MTLNRADVLVLLDQLGAASDDDALAAARSLSTMIGETGLAWDDLLLPSDGEDHGSFEDIAGRPDRAGYDDDDDADDDDDIEIDDDPDDFEEDLGDLGADHERLKRLLGSGSLSAQTREDLIALEDALRDGEFTLADRRYLVALEDRLG